MNQRPPLLRRMPREELSYRNLLAQRRRPAAFEWLDTNWEFAWMPKVAVREGLFDVQADWGGAHIVLRVDAAWLDQVAQQVLGAALSPAAPAPLVVALVEGALAQLAPQLEQATHRRLRVVGAGAVASCSGLSGVAWRLHCESLETTGELWVDNVGLGFLAEVCRVWPRDTACDNSGLDDLPVPLRLAVGWADIQTRQLTSLRRHDVVLLDECWLQDGSHLMLRVAEGLGLPCAVGKTTLQITEGFRRIMSDTLHPDETGDFDDSDDDADVSLDELPVRLSFDLGERTVTLAELRCIAPGYTFDLGRELRRAVIVRANGRAIGEGELVDIDGRMGVSLLTLKGMSS